MAVFKAALQIPTTHQCAAKESRYMGILKKMKVIAVISLLAVTSGFSASLLAEAVEQKVRIEVSKLDGGDCTVQAVFKGDHDNCKNDAAKGRADCSKDTGCTAACFFDELSSFHIASFIITTIFLDSTLSY